MDNLGYCCINQELRDKQVYCSRSLIKKTFTIEKASNLALQNCKDLLTILKWNEANNIKVFRITSDLFPRFTCDSNSYLFTDLKDHIEISNVLEQCGEFAFNNNHKLSFHPCPYTCLASLTESIRTKGITEIEYHSLLCDLLDPNDILDIPVNIHVGGSYEKTYVETSKRFVESFKLLSYNAQKRLVVENDDKGNLFTVKQLYDLLYTHIQIPITFDMHHWLFNHEDDRTMDQDFLLAKSTWGDRNMQVHYSESKNDKTPRSHSFTYVNNMPSFINLQDDTIHIHLECKGKEQGLMDVRKRYYTKRKVA